MFKNLPNSVFIGLGLGILVPGVLLSIIWYLMHKYAYLEKADLLLIAGVAVNALFMHYFFNRNKEQTGRAVISATFLWAILFYFYKINQ
ncbi:MAG: stationary phase survival protein SurE [Pedobacter sp.]